VEVLDRVELVETLRVDEVVLVLERLIMEVPVLEIVALEE
jgi:hypothetical protein